jgi:hypothetical protein
MKLLPALLSILILSLFFLAVKPGCGQTGIPDSTIIATIENEPVVAGELKLIAQQYRASTISRFLALCGCSYSSRFWATEVEGVTPSDYLKKMAFDTLVRIKVQQILARKYEIVNDITYAGFLRKLEQENQSREAAVRNHQVIYGPVKYSEIVYYNYIFREIALGLKKALDQAVFRISQDTLAQQYENLKSGLCSKGYLSEVILQQTDQQGAFTGSKNALTSSVIIVNDTVPLAEDDPSPVPQIRYELRGLKEGDFSRTFEYQGLNYRFQVIRKNPLGFRSLQECAGLVYKVLLDRRYELFINDKVKNAAVIIRKAAWDAVDF